MIPRKSISRDYHKVDDFNSTPPSTAIQRGRTFSDPRARNMSSSVSEDLCRGRTYSEMIPGSEAVKIYNAALLRRVPEMAESNTSRPLLDRTTLKPAPSTVFDHTFWSQHIGAVEPMPLPSRIPSDSQVILMPALVNGEPYTFNKVLRLINGKKDEGRLQVVFWFMSGITVSVEHGWEGNEPPGKLYWCPQNRANEQLLQHYTLEGKSKQRSWVPKYFSKDKRPTPLDYEGKEYRGKSYWCAFSNRKTEEGVFPRNLPTKEEICTLYMVNTQMGKVNMTSEKIMCQDIVPGIFKAERVFSQIQDNQITMSSTEDLMGMTRAYSILRFGGNSDWN